MSKSNLSLNADVAFILQQPDSALSLAAWYITTGAGIASPSCGDLRSAADQSNSTGISELFVQCTLARSSLTVEETS